MEVNTESTLQPVCGANIGSPLKPGIVVPEDVPMRQPPVIEPVAPSEPAPTKKEPVPA